MKMSTHEFLSKHYEVHYRRTIHISVFWGFYLGGSNSDSSALRGVCSDVRFPSIFQVVSCQNPRLARQPFSPFLKTEAIVALTSSRAKQH